LQGRDATPYLERNRVGRDAIDAASALTDMGKYLFLERRLPVYDIAVAITKLDMCRWEQLSTILFSLYFLSSSSFWPLPIYLTSSSYFYLFSCPFLPSLFLLLFFLSPPSLFTLLLFLPLLPTSSSSH
jgi:hypothetical protein